MLDPITEVEPRRDWDAAFKEALLGYTAKRPRRWRLGLAITIPAVLVAASLTGGILWVQAAVSNTNVVHCLARAELDPLGHYPGTEGAAAAPDSQGDRVEDALAACSAAWASGRLDPSAPDGERRGADGAPTYDETNSTAVPTDLRVCVMRDGSAAVVPGPADVCAQLGLARLG